MNRKLALILLAAVLMGGIAVVYFTSQPETPQPKETPSKASTDFHKTVPIEKRQYQQ